MSDTIHNPPVVLFDGVCNLCNRSVRWILKRDAAGVFRFASLQSESARRLLPPRLQNRGETPASVYLVDGNEIWEKSDAWFQIVRRLGGPWSALGCLRVLPRGLRDAVYDFIAKRRYRWFGKLDRCPLPDPRYKDRFLS